LGLELTAHLPRPELPDGGCSLLSAARIERWPDLQAVGVAFPTPLAAYAAVVARRGPHSSIDEVAGPHRPGEPTLRESWGAESLDLGIRVWPPLGREEAACRFHEMAWCDGGAYYRLSVINRNIQTHPEFAAAKNIHCVRDCKGAEAYAKAHAEYSAAHPHSTRTTRCRWRGPIPCHRPNCSKAGGATKR